MFTRTNDVHWQVIKTRISLRNLMSYGLISRTSWFPYGVMHNSNMGTIFNRWERQPEPKHFQRSGNGLYEFIWQVHTGTLSICLNMFNRHFLLVCEMLRMCEFYLINLQPSGITMNDVCLRYRHWKLPNKGITITGGKIKTVILGFYVSDVLA